MSTAPSAPVAPTELPPGFGADRASFPRTVTHFGGTTELTAPVERFAAISTGQFDSAVSVGLVPVASTHNADGELVPAYLPDPARFADVVDLGLRTAPDLQRVERARPDLVSATWRGRGRLLLPSLRSIAPTVLTEGKGFHWKQDHLLLGAALGRDAQAREVLARYRDRVLGLRDRVAPATVVSVLRRRPDGLEAHGHWSFCGSVLTDLGLRRPAAQDTPTNGFPVDALEPHLAADVVLCSRVPASPGVPPGTVEVGGSAWHGHAGPLAALTVLDDLERVLLG
ncbi:ABC transporter substrate-binding protein [Kineococcus arenarius]|uniref:hypothetical protein n=1 Tax=Kineococcus sp. SYSU DK007 TaxID=3383128 RepID=UPI003D7C4E21